MNEKAHLDVFLHAADHPRRLRIHIEPLGCAGAPNARLRNRHSAPRHSPRPHVDRMGRRRLEAPRLAGARPRGRAGIHRAPADLVVGPPDSRPVARRLDVPPGAPDFNKTFDVALHLGTLVAVVAYFWHDLIGYAVAWFRSVGHRSIRSEDEGSPGSSSSRSIPGRDRGALFQSVSRAPRRAVADRGLPRGLRVLLWLADRRPGAEDRRAPLRAGDLVGSPRRSRSRRGSRAPGSRSRWPRPPLRPRRGGAALLPAARPGRSRRGAPQGVDGRIRGELPTAGWARSSSARSRRRAAA